MVLAECRDEGLLPESRQVADIVQPEPGESRAQLCTASQVSDRAEVDADVSRPLEHLAQVVGRHGLRALGRQFEDPEADRRPGDRRPHDRPVPRSPRSGR